MLSISKKGEKLRSKKTAILISLLSTLIILASFTPLTSATKISFIFDEDVRFVADEDQVDVFYAHPDRNYYGISPLKEWSTTGERLYHRQVSKPFTGYLKGYASMLCSALAAYIGALVGGKYVAVVGALVGGLLATVLVWLADMYFIDERGCMWWWVSIALIEALVIMASTLAAYYNSNPVLASYYTSQIFAHFGYLRVGVITFYSNITPKWDYSDVKYDGTVDIYDVVAVASASGSEPGDSNWNREADVNYDGVIDILDVTAVALDLNKASAVFPIPDGF